MIKKLNLAMIGAGAIGGTIAAELIEKGYSVDVLDKNPEHIEAVNSSGLLIDGLLGIKTYNQIKIVDDLKDKKYDIIFLAVKSVQTEKACLEIKNNLDEHGVLISLQNGVNNETILPIIGAEHYIAGVVGFGATNKGPGHISITSNERQFVLGTMSGSVTPQLEVVAKILDEIGETEISDNILGEQWGKMAMNCVINPLCAIYDQTFGENVADNKIRFEMQQILTEVITVGQRAGIQFTKLGGKVDIEKSFTVHLIQDIIDITNKATSPTKRILDLLEYPIDLFKGSLFLRLVTLKHGKIKSSMWQDLQHGNKTEIDYLNGYISQLGKKYGVKTPINDQVTAKIKALETSLKV